MLDQQVRVTWPLAEQPPDLVLRGRIELAPFRKRRRSPAPGTRGYAAALVTAAVIRHCNTILFTIVAPAQHPGHHRLVVPRVGA